MYEKPGIRPTLYVEMGLVTLKFGEVIVLIATPNFSSIHQVFLDLW